MVGFGIEPPQLPTIDSDDNLIINSIRKANAELLQEQQKILSHAVDRIVQSFDRTINAAFEKYLGPDGAIKWAGV